MANKSLNLRDSNDYIKVKPNILVETHTDLDGAGAPVVATHFYGDRVREIHSTKNPALNDSLQSIINNKYHYEDYTIFICDHCPSMYMYQQLVESGLDFYIFDHHIRPDMEALDDPRVVIDRTRCGTKIFYDWIVKHDFDVSYLKSTPIKLFVDHVNDHDLWKHQLPKSKKLSTLLEELGWNRFLDRFTNDTSLIFTPGEELVLEIAEDKLQRYLSHYDNPDHIEILTDNLGDRYGAVFAETNQSELGHYLIEKYDLEYVMMINARSLACSLRSKGNTNVHEIAVEKGNLYDSSYGGHPAAAGFSYKITDLPDLIARVNLLTRRDDFDGLSKLNSGGIFND